ncbi:MAG: sigma-70 family RNA polymerase sigma factor, partial [Candidatus Baltobacteraceae bacterium]
GQIKSFLAVAVRNAAITMRRDGLRHTNMEKRLPIEEITQDPEMPDYLERSYLKAAIQSLPEEQWSVLRLAYFGHLTHVEIAKRLEVPVGTVKSRIALAIRKLRSVMPPREGS